MNSTEDNIIIKTDTTGYNHYPVSEWILSLSAMIWCINTHIVFGLATLRMRAKSWNNEWHRVKKTEQQSVYTALKTTSLPWDFSSHFSNEMWFQPVLWELGSCHAGYPCSAELHSPSLQHLPTGSTAQNCSRLSASDLDKASPWSQPAAHNEFVPFLWRARQKTDAGAGHWRNPNMAKMPRCVRTGIASKDRFPSSWWKKFP